MLPALHNLIPSHQSGQCQGWELKTHGYRRKIVVLIELEDWRWQVAFANHPIPAKNGRYLIRKDWQGTGIRRMLVQRHIHVLATTQPVFACCGHLDHPMTGCDSCGQYRDGWLLQIRALVHRQIPAQQVTTRPAAFHTGEFDSDQIDALFFYSYFCYYLLRF